MKLHDPNGSNAVLEIPLSKEEFEKTKQQVYDKYQERAKEMDCRLKSGDKPENTRR